MTDDALFRFSLYEYRQCPYPEVAYQRNDYAGNDNSHKNGNASFSNVQTQNPGSQSTRIRPGNGQRNGNKEHDAEITVFLDLFFYLCSGPVDDSVKKTAVKAPAVEQNMH